MSSEQRNSGAGGDQDPYSISIPDEPDAPTGLATRDRRAAPRFFFRVPVVLESGRASGKGFVHDMSSSGARIEGADLKLAEGARVKLGFRFFKDSPPIEIMGNVVRLTESGGFGVHFGKVDPRTRRALSTLLPKVASGRCEEDTARVFSGELVARLGATLHRACAEAAQAAGVPLNEWLTDRLSNITQEELADARKPKSAVHESGRTRNPYQR